MTTERPSYLLTPQMAYRLVDAMTIHAAAVNNFDTEQGRQLAAVRDRLLTEAGLLSFDSLFRLAQAVPFQAPWPPYGEAGSKYRAPEQGYADAGRARGLHPHEEQEKAKASRLLEEQVERLANFLMANFPGDIKGSSAIDSAITLIMRLDNSGAGSLYDAAKTLCENRLGDRPDTSTISAPRDLWADLGNLVGVDISPVYYPRQRSYKVDTVGTDAGGGIEFESIRGPIDAVTEGDHLAAQGAERVAAIGQEERTTDPDFPARMASMVAADYNRRGIPVSDDERAKAETMMEGDRDLIGEVERSPELQHHRARRMQPLGSATDELAVGGKDHADMVTSHAVSDAVVDEVVGDPEPAEETAREELDQPEQRGGFKPRNRVRKSSYPFED